LNIKDKQAVLIKSARQQRVLWKTPASLGLLEKNSILFLNASYAPTGLVLDLKIRGRGYPSLN